jgi:hypothetical protein
VLVSSRFEHKLISSAQIGNIPSNLRIVDYSHGHTGSAHDLTAFEGTGAHRFPDHLFKGEEFAWADSAYNVTERVIPIHKRPAADIPENARFDQAVSQIRVRCEHCMGALKGRWQCLRGLRLSINSQHEHVAACRWITICIILHNLCIDVEGICSVYIHASSLISSAGSSNLEFFIQQHDREEDVDATVDENSGGEISNAKRHRLVAEYAAARA